MPPAFAVPIIQGGANAVMNTFNQNQPGLNSLETGLTGGTLPGLQQQIGDTKTALQPGIDFAADTLGGKYLNSNPYIDNIVKQGEQDAGNAVNSAFSMAGRTGSGNHATDLARGVATAGNTIRANEYNQERANQMGALGALPGLTQAGFSGYTPLLAGTQLAGQLPFYGSSSLGTIGSLLGGYGTSSTNGKQPGGWGTDLLNGAMAALPFLL
jgi:hypothetical protein